MGGILTRAYLDNPLYQQNNDIRRVITCNTPHAGSQMANWLLDTTQNGPTFSSLLGQGGMSCYNGAVADLRVGTSIINGIVNGDILGDAQVHAITTTHDPLQLIFSSNLTYLGFINILGGLLVGTCGNDFMNDVFNSPLHDMVVAAESQDGSLGGIHVSTYQDQYHIGSVANVQVMDRVRVLLNESHTTTLFATDYTPFFLNYNVNDPCVPFTGDDPIVRSTPAVLEITSPASGADISAGSTLEIQYNTMGCDSVMSILWFKTDSVITLAADGNTSSMSMQLPDRVYGKRTLLMIGVDANKNLLVSDTVTLNFTTAATLESISVFPGELYLNPSDTTGLYIVGHFSDSIDRDITEDVMTFDFYFDHAYRVGQHSVSTDTIAVDTLVITHGIVESDAIPIHPATGGGHGNCGLVTSVLNEGPGTLRDILECATNGDTIFFDNAIAGDTIELDADILYLYKSVEILNTHAQPVVFRGDAYYLMMIPPDVDVTLKNIHLVTTHQNDVCLLNSGELTLENVTCRASGGDKGIVLNANNGVLEFKGVNNLQ